MSTVSGTMQAIQIQSQGDFDVIEKRDVPLPIPAEEDIMIKVEYSGVNFIDTYLRSGMYPIKRTPFTLGEEPAGEIVALPTSSRILEDPEYQKRNFKVGDKVVAYHGSAFAEYVSIPWSKVLKLPEGVDARAGAAALLQGLTAITFAMEAYEIKRGDYVLIYTAAGGVGLILTQIAVHMGAIVIGTTSSPHKADIVRQHGAQHVIVAPRLVSSSPTPPEEHSFVVQEVLRITNGEGVHGVFDGIGKDTFEDNFILTRRKGTIVSHGKASGSIPSFAPAKLGAKNLKLVRPRLDNYIYTPDELSDYANKLFDMIASGVVKLTIHKEYPFTAEGVKESQKDITGRSTFGKLVIKMA